jgi:squalene synthase HpnC
MTASAQLRSGKGQHDENFPVASWLIKRRHRAIILAFYEFVRVADDIADHATLGAGEKLARLDRLEASLLGETSEEPEGVRLGLLLRERGLSPRHAQDLLKAFRQDVTKLRYANWAELIGYCSLSAMPVGRFVLDVHDEQRSTWAASDALCAALQIINHLQDCGADYRNLDRVYIPLDALDANGIGVDALSEDKASPGLRGVLRAIADLTANLLRQSAVFSASIADTGLALEVAAIQALAMRLLAILRTHDPLSQQVHLTKSQVAAVSAGAVAREFAWRLVRRRSSARRYQTP